MEFTAHKVLKVKMKTIQLNLKILKTEKSKNHYYRQEPNVLTILNNLLQKHYFPTITTL